MDWSVLQARIAVDSDTISLCMILQCPSILPHPLMLISKQITHIQLHIYTLSFYTFKGGTWQSFNFTLMLKIVRIYFYITDYLL